MHVLTGVNRTQRRQASPLGFWGLWLASSITLLNLACGAGPSEVPGEWPIQRMKISRGAISVLLAPNVALGSVVELADFKGIEPGMRVEEAERVAGKPPFSERLFNAPAFTFALAGGRVSLVKRTVESEAPAREKWEVYAFPEGRKLEQLLSGRILSQLPNLTRRPTISVVGGAGQGLVSFTLTGENVQHIYWGRSGPR